MKWRVNCFCFVVRVYLCTFSFFFLTAHISATTVLPHCFNTPYLRSCHERSRVSKRNVSFGVKEHLLLNSVLWFVFMICCTHAPCNSFALLPASPFLNIFEGGALPTLCLHSSSASVTVGSLMGSVFYSKTLCVMGIGVVWQCVAFNTLTSCTLHVI